MLPTSCQKPIRGEQRLKQKRERRDTAAEEDRIKLASKRRDSYRCRWPHESVEEAARCRQLRVESCHTTHKGAGGDKQLIRTRQELLITFGLQCHDLFDGRVFGGTPRRVRFLTIEKADGPCAFDVHRNGRWQEIGREGSPGVLL